MSKLHVYPQEHNHDDAWLVGDRVSLTALRDALTRLLDGGGPTAASIQTFCEDGEGYTLIVMHEETGEAWQRLCLPYARMEDQRDGSTHPWSEVDDELYMTLVRGPPPST